MILIETQFDQTLTYRKMPKITIKGKALTLSLPDIPIKNIIVQTGYSSLDILDKYIKLRDFLEDHIDWLEDSKAYKISLKGGELYAGNDH